jgi:glycogen operon protein
LSLRIDGSKAEIEADRDDNDLFLIFNASSEKVEFMVCTAPGGKKWFLAIDTALHSPEDIKPEGEETLLDPREIYKASSRSLVVLISR